MSEIAEMQKMLDEAGIRFFTAKEAFYLGDSNGRLRLNTVPPKNLWPRIIPTLRTLDMARERVGRLRLSSVYRSPSYNRAVGGVSSSQHVQFRAADVVPMDTSVARLHSVLSELRRAGRWVGGLGSYPNFVHVDTRGYNSSW
jgi:uncharacterized protein YcbK (DUF882 family)